MQFSRNNCKPMVYVTSKSLARFLNKVGTSSFYRKNSLFVLLSQSKRLIYLDNFDYIRFRNYPNGDKGI